MSPTHGPIWGVGLKLEREPGKYHCLKHKGGCGVSSNFRSLKDTGKYIEIRCANCDRLINKVLKPSLPKSR